MTSQNNHNNSNHHHQNHHPNHHHLIIINPHPAKPIRTLQSYLRNSRRNVRGSLRCLSGQGIRLKKKPTPLRPYHMYRLSSQLYCCTLVTLMISMILNIILLSLRLIYFLFLFYVTMMYHLPTLTHQLTLDVVFSRLIIRNCGDGVRVQAMVKRQGLVPLQ